MFQRSIKLCSYYAPWITNDHKYSTTLSQRVLTSRKSYLFKFYCNKGNKASSNPNDFLKQQPYMFSRHEVLAYSHILIPTPYTCIACKSTWSQTLQKPFVIVLYWAKICLLWIESPSDSPTSILSKIKILTFKSAWTRRNSKLDPAELSLT